MLLLLIGSLLFFEACRSGSVEADQQATTQTNDQFATSPFGMVSTAHPLATAAGLEMLDKGGNAVDAAVAAAFTLTVVEPAMSGLGGRLQAIVRTEDGEVYGIDATTQAPMTYDPETAPQAKYGYAVIGVPGLVAGLVKLNKEHGSLPLADVIAPAIRYADEGFKQLSGQVHFQNRVRKELMEFEGSREYFIRPNDTIVYGPADLLIQKDLAHSLQLIAEQGPDVFYKGEIAKKMVEDVSKHGGALTIESLENYEALDAPIMKGSYRGHDVYGLWIPSFGAITIEILQILENLPMNDYTEAEWASAMYQAIKIGYEDRYKQKSIEIGDHLTNKDYAREQAQRIHVGQSIETGQNFLNKESFLTDTDILGHTTHLSVADESGMVIALTQSLGPIMGSRVATPGLGFLYAATLGGYLGPFEPGQRAASHISPMILTNDNKPYMGIGAAGGARINSAIIQAICRVIDRNMNLFEALEAPRVHPTGEGVTLEMHDSLAWNGDDLRFLRENGFIIEENHEPFRFGRVHAVMYQNAEWIGAADPDGEGVASGPDKALKLSNN